MKRRHRTVPLRLLAAFAALLGLTLLLVASAGLAAVPESVDDERRYLRATACPGAESGRAADCLADRPARVAGVVIRDEARDEEFTLRLRKAAGLPEEIDMGGAGPLLDRLGPGDEVTVTLWRDYAVAVTRGATVQRTADTPEGEAESIIAVVLALLPAGVFLLHTGGTGLVRARAWARDGLPAVLVVRAKWAFGAALCALPAVVLAEALGLGPVAEALAWCAMVPLVRWYLYRGFARARGRHSVPLAARSTIR